MLLVLLACTSGSPPGDSATAGTTGTTGTADPTWYGDVAPIVAEHCASCHAAGQIGPFPLDSYAAASATSMAIAGAVSSRSMPPWLAADDCTTYRDDPTLTDDEIATLVAWAEAGAPEGDPDTAATLPDPPGPALSRVDYTLQMPSAYTPTQSPDDYRCFALDWPLDETMYVTGYDVRPENPAIVHHVIAYIAPPEQVAAYQAADDADPGEGWTCFGGPGVGSQEDAQWLGGWAPGGTDGDFPNGTGISVEPGSKIVLQVHYNTAAASAGPDQTAFDVMVEPEVENPAMIQPWADPDWLYGDSMLIPAGASGVEHEFAYTMPAGVEFRIHTANLHMHKLGTDARLWVERPDGTEDCLLDIPRWDFAWQRTYVLEEPVTVNGGTLHVRCHWDNPTDADVAWGEGTGDEMCLGTMLWSY